MTLAAACGAPPAAPSTAAAPIEIADAWAASTPDGVTVSAGYMRITNSQDTAETLVAIESPRAGRAELHEMAMEDGVMRMRRVEGLVIEPGQSALLSPRRRASYVL
ncbi:MAG: copper chaperone PCu(A)C [Terricaulis sp.]|nr:copper chaperone PCu(A)C [Terricaulis sp.]